jgi:LPXTG-site transpeptidase (sortase) family protein
VLEKVIVGDTITVTMVDGTVYTYAISNITIYDNTADLQLTAVDGKTLALVTCYPFRYGGHAPGKCVVTATYIN